ncbi:AAA family ATPase [Phytohabitans sp. ZYX-F-186]|uniref:AAA family ATPase n=1 Tax=Phytohabitans maris TaxID=3071409 RepID=A0ABU0ZT79_9ACTN|nr:AAA family ATPase [Phytohabitans sp. ZYX-F-186]MDQ7910244.1 AAA family ATPase [Phytohabitans sp. ZYX-F-186]
MNDYDHEAAWEALEAAGVPTLLVRPEKVTVPDTPEAAVQAAQDQEDAHQRAYRRLLVERTMWHKANREAVRRVQAEEAAASTVDPVGPLDWSTFLTQEMPPPDWHAGRLFSQGQQVTVVGEGKAGKSMFCQEMAWRDAAGLPFLGDTKYRARRVMYVDHENGQQDIQSRFVSFGATPETLANLAYLSFPAHRPLDTEGGAADFLADVDRYQPEIVYLDTVSRVISDEENSSAPWLAMYRLLTKHLKARGITSVRIDHFGKDHERGSRGSSAKSQDIDTVWELRNGDNDTLTLTRTFTRNGIGRSYYRLRRLGEIVGEQWRPGATAHVLADEPTRRDAAPGEFIAAAQVADQLDAAGVPLDLGRDKVRALIKDKGLKISANNNLLAEALKLRKKRAEETTQGETLMDGVEALRATIRRCHACGLLPGEMRHEVNCVFGRSTPEHVAEILDYPLEEIRKVRAEWDGRLA